MSMAPYAPPGRYRVVAGHFGPGEPTPHPTHLTFVSVTSDGETCATYSSLDAIIT